MSEQHQELIFNRWDVTHKEFTDLIDENPSLRGMVLGYLAEQKLRLIFQSDKRVTSIHKEDDHDRRKKGDLVVVYKEVQFVIESKALQSNSILANDDGTYDGKVQCDASDRRTIQLADGSSITTTCLKFGEFDILAACLFSFKNEWLFSFIRNADLPSSTYNKYSEVQRKQLIKTLIPVTLPIKPPFTNDPFRLMDDIIAEKQRLK